MRCGNGMSGTPGLAEALLIDFGGVLTTDVFESFRAFAAAAGADPDIVERLLLSDKPSSEALAEHESGQKSVEEFEIAFATRLKVHGVDENSDGLLSRMVAGLRPNVEMIEGISRLREHGIPIVLVSNSLGYEVYEGYELSELCDEVVLSGDVGVRKPSRRIYEIGAERAGVSPSRCVMVDDLPWNIRGAERVGMQGVHHVSTQVTLAELRRHFHLDW